MSHSYRVFVRRQRPLRSREPSVEKAPRALRSRVLGSVRSRPLDRPAHGGPLAPAAAKLIAFAVVLAILAVSLIVVNRDSPRRGAGGGAAASVQLRRVGGHGELEIADMAEPPLGEVYELWLLRRSDHTLQPTDVLFTVTNAGSATVDIPGNLRSSSEALVTAEPLGGSVAPTSSAVLRVPLRASA
jgi:hypothetical protein